MATDRIPSRHPRLIAVVIPRALGDEQTLGNMTRDQKRAAQRLGLMRMAAPALMPSPNCLVSAPTTCMQLHHRESVVQFINEVTPL